MDTNGLRSLSQRWIWIASIWFGFGLVDAAQTVFVMRKEGMHHVWAKLFAATVFFWLPWALATEPILRLGRRFPLAGSKRFVNWIAHLAACAAIGLLFTAWTTWLARFFNLYGNASATGPFAQLWFDKFLSGILSSLVLYAGVLAVSYFVDSRARLAHQQTETARLNEQLSKAQLEALRRQIEPHFLFNTLNAVSGLVRAGSYEAAVTMIAGLSDFLRHTLKGPARQQVSLREEMEFAQTYLNIQQVRFVGRLRLTVDVPLELYQAEVPSLILQPIVENAVKHGIAKRVQGGSIRITASRRDGILTLAVCNDGPSLSPADLAGSGIGSTNVRTRLHSLYGDAFEFIMRNGEGGGVEVSVSFPFAVCPQSAAAEG